MNGCKTRRRTGASTLIGVIVWLMVPWLPVGDPPPAGSLEHMFLFFPLAAAPPLFALASALLQPQSSLYRRARAVQPLASAAVLLSFLVAHGPLAGALVLPWLAFAIVLAIAGVPAALRTARPHRASVSLLAAHIFLPLGGVWLGMSRLGTGPAHLGGLGVFLAVVHFHFSGFALQTLIAATAHRVPAALAAVQRRLAIAGVVGIPLIAMGRLLQIAPLQVVGVATVILATLTLAVLAMAVAWTTRPGPARALLVVSSASIAAAMLLAASCGIGQLTGAQWLGVERMVTTHGLLNALGFVTCGTIAHLRLTADAAAR